MGNASALYDEHCLTFPTTQIINCPVYREHLRNKHFLNQFGKSFERFVYQNYKIVPNFGDGERSNWYQLLGQAFKNGGQSLNSSDHLQQFLVTAGKAEVLIGKLDDNFAMSCNSKILIHIQEMRSFCQSHVSHIYKLFCESQMQLYNLEYNAINPEIPQSHQLQNLTEKRVAMQNLHIQLHKDIWYVYENMVSLKQKIPSMIEHQLEVNLYSVEYLQYLLYILKDSKFTKNEIVLLPKYKENIKAYNPDFREILKIQSKQNEKEIRLINQKYTGIGNMYKENGSDYSVANKATHEKAPENDDMSRSTVSANYQSKKIAKHSENIKNNRSLSSEKFSKKQEESPSEESKRRKHINTLEILKKKILSRSHKVIEIEYSSRDLTVDSLSKEINNKYTSKNVVKKNIDFNEYSAPNVRSIICNNESIVTEPKDIEKSEKVMITSSLETENRSVLLNEENEPKMVNEELIEDKTIIDDIKTKASFSCNKQKNENKKDLEDTSKQPEFVKKHNYCGSKKKDTLKKKSIENALVGEITPDVLNEENKESKDDKNPKDIINPEVVKKSTTCGKKKSDKMITENKPEKYYNEYTSKEIDIRNIDFNAYSSLITNVQIDSSTNENIVTEPKDTNKSEKEMVATPFTIESHSVALHEENEPTIIKKELIKDKKIVGDTKKKRSFSCNKQKKENKKHLEDTSKQSEIVKKRNYCGSKKKDTLEKKSIKTVLEGEITSDALKKENKESKYDKNPKDIINPEVVKKSTICCKKKSDKKISENKPETNKDEEDKTLLNRSTPQEAY